MTKVTISGNANGTGNVNFAAPNTNSAITVTLPTSNVDMDSLGPSTTFDDVGTYILGLRIDSGSSLGNGATISGSSLMPCAVSGDTSGTTVSGTWGIMGYTAPLSTTERKISVCVRIS